MAESSKEPQVVCQLVISKSMESSLADRARAQRTTVNDVIHQALSDCLREGNASDRDYGHQKATKRG